MSATLVSSLPLAPGARVTVSGSEAERTSRERSPNDSETGRLPGGASSVATCSCRGRAAGSSTGRVRLVADYPAGVAQGDERIRVLRVIARMNVGGPALHVSYLTKGLADRGYDTTLVAGRVGDDEGSMEYAARELGRRASDPPGAGAGTLPPAPILRRSGFARLIREFRPHIVHTHTAKAGAVGRVAAVAARLPDRPLIVHTFHGHVLEGYFAPAQTRFFSQTERSLARRTDRLIAVSHQVRDDLVAQRIAPFEKFEVIRLGLDLDARATPDPVAAAALRDELGISGTSSLDRVARANDRDQAGRRPPQRVRAPARTRRRRPSAARRRRPSRVSNWRSWRADLDVADQTHFLGMQRDVAPVYGAADIVALTSANEGTPVSLIEALAAGTATLSTDVGGVRDVVRDGETGLLVPAGDVAAIAGGARASGARP